MLEIGSFLSDRYEILSKVGAGGMSDVYKAKDHILSRFVAIKVLKQEFSEDSSFVTKFRAEAQSAAGLEHPNIVNIYDVGSENGLYYIVMEYVEGITLKTYIEKKGQLSFKESASIAIQVARGIEAAHNKNIIHRDIKPQNIIISTDGKVKVTDFGIAKATSSNTISSDVMGSVHYASPEQARNGFVDGRSDIYSLGIVMFEMVTGRVPFDGDTTVAVALQHLQEEIARPSIYAPDLPISFEKIILKCTQKTPDRRYQTIEELLTDIRRSLAHPDEDFVTIAPLVDGGKTKVISPEELDKIKEGRGVAEDLNDDDTDADNDDEYADGEDDDDEYDESLLDDDDDEEEYVKPERKAAAPKQTKAPKQTAKQAAPSTSNKITPMRKRNSGNGTMEVCVIKPSSMEDTREIADTLIDRCTVVLNLEGIDVDVAQRIIDFSSGACYSIAGSLQKISSYIFILTPANVEISGDFQEILSGAFDVPSVRTNF